MFWYDLFLKICVVTAFGGAIAFLFLVIAKSKFADAVFFLSMGSLLVGWLTLRAARFLGFEPPPKQITKEE